MSYNNEQLVQEVLTFAKKLAHDAGVLLADAYAAQPVASAVRTSPKEMKLAEDKTIDKWLVQKIQEQYPDHDILTEESGSVDSIHELNRRKDNQHVLWVIDPIDGSVNFSNNNPFFAISLAIMIDGELIIGAIEAPLLQEQYVAVRGQGATVNEQPLHVSKIKELQDAYLVSCDGGVTDRTVAFSTMIRAYYDQVKDYRKLGSAALECAWVATGRADAYVTMAIDSWDVAAGILLVQEAGGKVTTFDGSDWELKQSDVICSNGLLHEQLTDRIWT